MKRFLSIIILCMSVLGISAQPANGGFRLLLSYGQTPVNVNTIISMLTLNPAHQFTHEEAERYGHEQLLNDMYELFIPYYRPVLNFDDISFILSIYRSPDVRQALRHLDVLTGVASNEQGKYTSPGISAIINGKSPDPVALNPGISKSYLDACAIFFQATGQMERLAELKNLRPNTADDGANHLSGIADYLIANTPTVNANVAHGKVAESELRLIAGLYETTAFKHFKLGNNNLSAHSYEVFTKIVERAQAWKAKKSQQGE